ncbi:MAG: SHOCT domain-containing protein [Actinobacteria bacterium]|nr:SHOCT domain-containing protein [Actinomycetota bacterium]
MEDYPLLHMLWTILLIFGFVIWFWLLITVFSDLFRRHDIGGGKKVLWIILLFATNIFGVLIYLLVNGHGMAERNQKAVATAQKQFDDHVKEVAGGSAAEIAHAKSLLDSGAITQEEFDTLKKKALS